jgi:hypothetical protein
VPQGSRARAGPAVPRASSRTARPDRPPCRPRCRAQPLWRGRADAVVCWGLGQAWRAPQLVELLAPSKRQLSRALGPWRAWRVSGALLELSAWASSQPLCLAAHTYLHTAAAAAAAAAASSAAAANEDAAAAEDGAAAAAAAAAGSDAASSSRHAQQAAVLAKLQQQLDVRRRARQQALEQHQRRQRRRQQKQQQHPGRGQEAHSTSADDGASHDEPPQSQLRGATRASQAQAAALWVLLLGGVSCLLLRRRDRLLLAAGAAAVAGALCGVGSRLLLPDEASVGQLAALLATDTPQSGLVRGAGGAGLGSRLACLMRAPPPCCCLRLPAAAASRRNAQARRGDKRTSTHRRCHTNRSSCGSCPPAWRAWCWRRWPPRARWRCC